MPCLPCSPTLPSPALSDPLEQFLGSFSILLRYWEALLPLVWCFKLCVSLSKPTHSWKMVFSAMFTVSESIFAYFCMKTKIIIHDFKWVIWLLHCGLLSKEDQQFWGVFPGWCFQVKLKTVLPFELSLSCHFSIKVPLQIYRDYFYLFIYLHIWSFFSPLFSQGSNSHYLNKLWSDSLSRSPPGAELGMPKLSRIMPCCCTWITVLIQSLDLVLIGCIFFFLSLCVDLKSWFKEWCLLCIQPCSLMHSTVPGFLWPTPRLPVPR